MASEIRANKQTNRVGLGTVTYTDTGIIVSGIVTANSFKGDGSSLTGIDATALKDTGGAVKIQAEASGAIHSGISTFNEINLGDGKFLELGNSNDFRIHHSSSENTIDAFGGHNVLIRNTYGVVETMAKFVPNGAVELYFNDSKKIESTNTGAVVTGILTATSFSGDGSSLSNLPAGAPVGGATTNTVFFENDKEVAVNYQITSTKNAMSAGPLQINAGIAVTVPSGCSWTIV